MKSTTLSLITVAMLAAMPLSASAQASPTPEQWCNAIGILAYSTMSARQSGMAMQTLIQGALEETNHPETEELATTMILLAFTYPIQPVFGDQVAVSNRFRDDYIDMCFMSFQGS